MKGPKRVPEAGDSLHMEPRGNPIFRISRTYALGYTKSDGGVEIPEVNGSCSCAPDLILKNSAIEAFEAGVGYGIGS